MLDPQRRLELPRSLSDAILRGIRCRCPRCGEAKLFRKFLKPVDFCPQCHQDWTHQRADDMPPYISILITGHVLAPVIIYFGAFSDISMGAALAICLALATVMMIGLLQPAKGGTIALQWWHGMHGFAPSGKEEADRAAAPAKGSGPWG
ncbi:MAG: DUF983 domain-containing protein [Novosphingobium sp.]